MITVIKILIGNLICTLGLFIPSKPHTRTPFHKMFIKLGFSENYIFSILPKGKIKNFHLQRVKMFSIKNSISESKSKYQLVRA